MCSDYGLELLGKIPLDPLVVKSCDAGEYVGDKYKDSKVLEAYENIGKSRNFYRFFQSEPSLIFFGFFRPHSKGGSEREII